MTFTDRITSIPALVLTALALASGSYTRSFEETSGRDVHLTQAKLMLDDVTDTRFLANVVLTVWLVTLVVRAPADSSPDRLIRRGSYLRALVAACGDGLRWATAIAPLVLVGMYVTTLGLPLADDGSRGIDGFAPELQRPGWPWLAVILASLALALALLLVTQLITLALHLAVPLRGLDIAFAVVVGMLTLLSAAGLVDAGSPWNVGRLTTVLIVASAPVAALSSWTVVLATCAGCLLLVRATDRTHRPLPVLVGGRRP